MRIPVYLACAPLTDATGTVVTIRERRLTRLSERDRVIAVIEAPRGTRIRRRRDAFGVEQLVVPLGTSLWSRLFGPMAVVPAKYVISSARDRTHGLRLISNTEAIESPA